MVAAECFAEVMLKQIRGWAWIWKIKVYCWSFHWRCR